MSVAIRDCDHPACRRCPLRESVDLIVAERSEAVAGCPHRVRSEAARAALGGRLGLGDLRVTRAAAGVLPAGWAPADLLRDVELGRLVLLRRPFVPEIRGFDVAPPPTEPELRGAPPPTVRTWIEVQLVDEECEPIEGERYEIRLPDGTVRTGQLNYLGKVRFDDVDAGQCQITFPDLDRDAWKAEVVCPEPVTETRTYLEFSLVDMEGDPVPAEFYRVTLPSGAVIEGYTNVEGKVRFEGLDPGTAQITFPDLDAEAWEAAANA